MHKLLIFLFLTLILSPSLAAKEKKKKRKKELVLVETNFGNMKLKLYDETPLHKENFLKLVEEGNYDSSLFHRVIKDFMIQGGDPDSKKAVKGQELGNGGLGYTLQAEFIDSLFHKRGALAAARMGDDVNPNKESSSCQFYIVHGRKFTETDLQMLEKQINNNRKNALYQSFFDNAENSEFKKRLLESQRNGNQEAYQGLLKEIQPEIDERFENEKFSFTKAQIEAYTSIGGAPHLDGTYTVFGELIEGFDVLDKIANQPCDTRNRPLEDIRLQMKLVKR